MIQTLKTIKRAVKGTYIQASQAYYKVAGNAVECNICHYKANHLASDAWHRYSYCPSCRSTVRHRLMMAALSLLEPFRFEQLIRNKSVLHFAPETHLEKIMRSQAGTYKTADFLADGYSYNHIDYDIDISAMTTIADASFDCVIACDVLEHVPNHLKAIDEVYRVLKPGGYCVFTIPQKDDLEQTLEDPTVTSPQERKQVYGQVDHLRIYGHDFTDMLTRSGFVVTGVDESFFSPEVAARHVLFPPVLSKHPLATNYRKVFFGMK